MSNDISTGSGAAAPAASPSAAPSSTPSTPSTPSSQTSTADLAKLTEGDDIGETGFAEQRLEDQGLINPNASEAQREFNRQQKLTHHQRDKLYKQQLKADNAAKDARIAELEARGGPQDIEQQAAAEQSDGSGDEQQPPQETPEEFQERLTREVRKTLEREERATLFRHHERIFAQSFPDYDAVVAQGPQVPISQEAHELLESEPKWGPVIKYGLSHPQGQAEFVAFVQAPPQEQVRIVYRILGQLEAGARHSRVPQPQQYQPRRVTQAPRPITPLRGAGSPPANLHGLASSDKIDAYAAQRLRQMNAAKSR